MRYSVLQILKEGLTGNRGWKPVWREPDPKRHYDVIVIGGGGHGLATAYYLATVHGLTDVAVLEKGWLGSGNVGRNTTIVRSNYMLPGNEPFYELSMKLWEGLEQDFNYNAMVSQRGIINLYHSDAQRDAAARRANAMILAGADGVLLDRKALQKKCPYLDFDNERFPIKGGLWQPRGGTVRHDAVAWGYGRGADRCGVDLIQNCEVTGFDIRNGVCHGVETPRGTIGADRVAVCVAGSSGRVMGYAGLRLPDRKPCVAGLRDRRAEAHNSRSHYLWGRALLRQPVRQGRAGLRRRYRRLQQLCPARQPADDRGRVRGRHGADADDRPGAGPAHVGRLGRHVDGRLALHRQDAGRRAVLQRRLELWRLQGDSGERLLLRPPDRDRRTAPGRHGNAAGPFRAWRRDRRKGRRRPAEPALEARGMIIDHPLLGPRDAAEFVVLGDASLIDRPDWQAEDAAQQFHDYLHLRDNPAGEHRELWFHEQGDRSWLVVTRNTLTHEVLEVELARDVAVARGRDR